MAGYFNGRITAYLAVDVGLIPTPATKEIKLIEILAFLMSLIMTIN